METKKVGVYWLLIPATVFFALTFAAFIISSFFDWEIAVYFGNFFHRPFGKFLAYWAFNSGNVMLFFSIIASVALIIETFYLHSKQSTHDHWLKRNSWFIWFLYGLFFTIYIGLNLYQIITLPTKNTGWGKGIVVPFVATYHTLMYYKIGFFVFGLFFYIFMTWFIRYFLPKKPYFLVNCYWIDGIKILIFSIVLYLTVGILKIAFARPFYFSNIFDETIRGELSNVPGAKEETWSTWQNLPYHEWWQPFRFVQHMKDIFTGKFNGHLYNDDFPSGHMASCMILFSIVYYALDKKRGKLFPIMAAFSALMWIQVLAIFFGMIIYRFHWMTDMCFTFLVAVCYFVILETLFRKKYTAKLLKAAQKQDKISRQKKSTDSKENRKEKKTNC
ncbi:hypothetical protein JN01_0394 [Entomoplasma freundtii]|uniref:Uncharacterized protein n=1 Tax=Entomoplasma freundtii TaxID=74700 RepID=A0A2K8NQR7_9MOLU|nr:hypothetical protein [Entomoplasma freundtii]ATZ16195.1 hypothetical protein EFREU_v1c01680 [Entomoplasma freundtii]TDY56904.1 hypothetical protein JN01_0394 [Entomoplasma freundtii]